MANTITITINAKDQASSTLKSMSDNFDKNLKRAGLAVTAVGVALSVYAKQATDYATEFYKGARSIQTATGMTAQQASTLSYVTQRLGLDTQQTANLYGFFSKQIVAAAQAAQPADTALGRLNVTVKNANGSTRDFNSVLLDTADRFKAMPDGPEKTALALELFGKSGKDMIKVMNQGSAGIKDLQQQAEKLGFSLNAQSIGTFSRYISSQKDLKDTTNALKIQVGQLTAPVLTEFNNKLNGLIRSATSADSPLRGLTTRVLAFGGPVATAAGGFLTFAGNLSSALPLIRGVGAAIAAASGPILALAAVAAAAYGAWRILKAAFGDTSEIKRMDDAQQDLNSTLEQQATTIQDVKDATRGLHDAQFDAAGAALDVERAQRSYNEAVRDYGKKSLEAREASHALEGAKQTLADAQQKVADTQATVNAKEAEYALQTPGATAAIDARIVKYDTLSSKLTFSIDQAVKLDGQINTVSAMIQPVAQIGAQLQGANSNAVQLGTSINLLQNPANNLQQTLTNINQMAGKLNGVSVSNNGKVSGVSVSPSGGSISVSRRASGGSVTAGQPYAVGDNPDGTFNRTTELFIPNQNGSIVPADKAGGMFGGVRIENLNVHNNVDIGVIVREIGWQLQLR